MVKCYHSSQTCWDCRWSPIQGSNKSKKVPWKYGMIKFSEKMFRWYIPEVKVHLKRVLVLLAISLNWFVMVQKRWKSYREPLPRLVLKKCGPNPNPQPHRPWREASTSHKHSLPYKKKTEAGDEEAGLKLKLMTYDYPYDTVKTPKKEQHLSLLWNKLQNLEPNPVGNDSIYPWK